MKIFQFISEYCQDLVDEVKLQRQLVDLSEYPHDSIITDAEGNDIPVVVVDSQNIPVSDFLTLDRSDFLAAYNLPSAAEAFDNYMDAFEILEGPEALNRIRNAILAEKDRLAQDVQLITEV